MDTLLQNLPEVLGHLLKPPYLYYAAVAIVLLVCLYFIYSLRRASQGIVPFKTEGGTIEIAPSTLRGVIQHAANSVKGVEKASCRHFLKGRNVGVKIAVHLQANHRLKEVESAIKRAVRVTLFEQFGMENVQPIHIRVTRIIGDPLTARDPRYADELNEARAGLLEPGEGEDERPYAGETRI